MSIPITREIPFDDEKSIVPRFDTSIDGIPKAGTTPSNQKTIEETGRDENTAEIQNIISAKYQNEIQRILMELVNVVGNMNNIFIDGVEYSHIGEALARLAFNQSSNSAVARIFSVTYGIGVYKNRWDSIYGSVIQEEEEFLPPGMFECLNVDQENKILYIESGTCLADAIFTSFFRKEFSGSDPFAYAYQLTAEDTEHKYNVTNAIGTSSESIYDWVDTDKRVPVSTINKAIVEDIVPASDLESFLNTYYPSGMFNKYIKIVRDGNPDRGIIYQGVKVRNDAETSGYSLATLVVGLNQNGTPPTTTNIDGEDYLDFNDVNNIFWTAEIAAGGSGATADVIISRWPYSIYTDPDDATIGRVGSAQVLSGGEIDWDQSYIPVILGSEIDALPTGSEVYLVYQYREPRIDLIQAGEIQQDDGSLILDINIKKGTSDNIIPSRDFNNVPLWSFKINEYNEIVNPETNREFQTSSFYGPADDLVDERRIIDTEYTKIIHTRELKSADPASMVNLTDAWQLIESYDDNIIESSHSLAGNGVLRYRLQGQFTDSIVNTAINRLNLWKIQIALAINNANLLTNPDIVIDFNDAYSIYNVPGNFNVGNSSQLKFPVYDDQAPSAPPLFAQFIAGVSNKIEIDSSGEGALPHDNIDPKITGNDDTGILYRDPRTSPTPFLKNHSTLVLINQDNTKLLRYGRFVEIDFSKTYSIYANDDASPNNLFSINTSTGAITSGVDGQLPEGTYYAFYRLGSEKLNPAKFLPFNYSNKYEWISDYFNFTQGNNLALIARINNDAGSLITPPGSVELYGVNLIAYKIDGISDIAYGQNQYQEHLYGY